MQLLERVRKTEFLGREFLLWLWYTCETREGLFDLGDGGRLELWIDRKIVLQGESDRGVEKVACTGENPKLREARFALTEGKEITEAMIRLIIGDDEWSFILDAQWLNFKAFKPPKVAPDVEQDPDGLFYERYFLLEKAVTAMDALFGTFIKLRMSPEWEISELPEMTDWIREGV
ncbi:MAG: hypothetical protein JRK53_13530 [Deltaproteobacteria bacterium]|nr:hypothetical protein [Deltaproteobacteria bacterium]